jgi:site-specific DNA-methyltransferase (adenine-specific)
MDSRLALFPEPFHKRPRLLLYRGDCRKVVPDFAEGSLDGCVTDPPYHLIETTKRFANHAAERTLTNSPGVYVRHAKGFMGKDWDGGDVAFDPATWAAMLRVLKPGAFLVAFGGSRTYHRLACAVEDGGFIVHDSLAWLYGSGFPKSHNVGLSIDKLEGHPNRGHEIAVASHARPDGKRLPPGELLPPYQGITEQARQWDGWGTALKPAMELIVLAQKPREGTYAHNVLTHGVGALNIDATRIGTGGESIRAPQSNPANRSGVVGTDLGITGASAERFQQAQRESAERTNALGRWPANVLLSHSPECVQVGTARVAADGGTASSVHKTVYNGGWRDDRGRYNYAGGDGKEEVPVWDCAPDCAVAALDRQSGHLTSGALDGERHRRHTPKGWSGPFADDGDGPAGRGSWGGDSGGASRFFYTSKASQRQRAGTDHPTVKPADLMAWLCRLIIPPGGLVLDPFAGTGTTAYAALGQGMAAVLIEGHAPYAADIARRAFPVGMALE